MQFNRKTDVNIIKLCDEFIDNLNKLDENKVYSLRITNKAGKSDFRPNEKKGKESKPGATIVFAVADTETKERVTLYDATYTFNDVSEQLKGTYRKKLYEYFLYGCVTGYALQAEHIIKRRNIHKNIELQEKMAKLTEPVTPEDAIDPKSFIATE